MQNNKYLKQIKFIFIILFILVNILIFYIVLCENRNNFLKIAFLDVGQGDAIFIESPNGNQILIDAGPNKNILSALGAVMPFYDRNIDAILSTHPDSDHISGFPEVLKNYSINKYFYSGATGTTDLSYEIIKEIENKNIKTSILRSGDIINMGGGAYLYILYPDKDPQGKDTNEYSIVARLVYGESSVLLTGDAPTDVENRLVNTDGIKIHSDILKVAHHGSRNSLSLNFLSMVGPKYSIISAGIDNRYGHPHKEVLNYLDKIKSIILKTSDLGNIIFISDGKKLNMIQ